MTLQVYAKIGLFKQVGPIAGLYSATQSGNCFYTQSEALLPYGLTENTGIFKRQPGKLVARWRFYCEAFQFGNFEEHRVSAEFFLPVSVEVFAAEQVEYRIFIDHEMRIVTERNCGIIAAVVQALLDAVKAH